jgi:hypothetical protein
MGETGMEKKKSRQEAAAAAQQEEDISQRFLVNNGDLCCGCVFLFVCVRAANGVHFDARCVL